MSNIFIVLASTLERNKVFCKGITDLWHAHIQNATLLAVETTNQNLQHEHTRLKNSVYKCCNRKWPKERVTVLVKSTDCSLLFPFAVATFLYTISLALFFFSYNRLSLTFLHRISLFTVEAVD